MFFSFSYELGSIKEFEYLSLLEINQRAVFEDCLKKERKKTNEERKVLSVCFGKNLRSKELGLRHLDKGIYAEQLHRWFLRFPREKFFILFLEEWKKNPSGIFVQLLTFLGLNDSISSKENCSLSSLSNDNSLCNSSYSKTIDFTKKRLELPNSKTIQLLSPSLTSTLQKFYRPYNKELEILLGRTLPPEYNY